MGIKLTETTKEFSTFPRKGVKRKLHEKKIPNINPDEFVDKLLEMKHPALLASLQDKADAYIQGVQQVINAVAELRGIESTNPQLVGNSRAKLKGSQKILANRKTLFEVTLGAYHYRSDRAYALRSINGKDNPKQQLSDLIQTANHQIGTLARKAREENPDIFKKAPLQEAVEDDAEVSRQLEIELSLELDELAAAAEDGAGNREFGSFINGLRRSDAESVQSADSQEDDLVVDLRGADPTEPEVPAAASVQSADPQEDDLFVNLGGADPTEPEVPAAALATPGSERSLFSDDDELSVLSDTPGNGLTSGWTPGNPFKQMEREVIQEHQHPLRYQPFQVPAQMLSFSPPMMGAVLPALRRGATITPHMGMNFTPPGFPHMGMNFTPPGFTPMGMAMPVRRPMPIPMASTTPGATEEFLRRLDALKPEVSVPSSYMAQSVHIAEENSPPIDQDDLDSITSSLSRDNEHDRPIHGEEPLNASAGTERDLESAANVQVANLGVREKVNLFDRDKVHNSTPASEQRDQTQEEIIVLQEEVKKNQRKQRSAQFLEKLAERPAPSVIATDFEVELARLSKETNKSDVSSRPKRRYSESEAALLDRNTHRVFKKPTEERGNSIMPKGQQQTNAEESSSSEHESKVDKRPTKGAPTASYLPDGAESSSDESSSDESSSASTASLRRTPKRRTVMTSRGLRNRERLLRQAKQELMAERSESRSRKRRFDGEKGSEGNSLLFGEDDHQLKPFRSGTFDLSDTPSLPESVQPRQSINFGRTNDGSPQGETGEAAGLPLSPTGSTGSSAFGLDSGAEGATPLKTPSRDSDTSTDSDSQISFNSVLGDAYHTQGGRRRRSGSEGLYSGGRDERTPAAPASTASASASASAAAAAAAAAPASAASWSASIQGESKKKNVFWRTIERIGRHMTFNPKNIEALAMHQTERKDNKKTKPSVSVSASAASAASNVSSSVQSASARKPRFNKKVFERAQRGPVRVRGDRILIDPKFKIVTVEYLREVAKLADLKGEFKANIEQTKFKGLEDDLKRDMFENFALNKFIRDAVVKKGAGSAPLTDDEVFNVFKQMSQNKRGVLEGFKLAEGFSNTDIPRYVGSQIEELQKFEEIIPLSPQAQSVAPAAAAAAVPVAAPAGNPPQDNPYAGNGGMAASVQPQQQQQQQDIFCAFG